MMMNNISISEFKIMKYKAKEYLSKCNLKVSSDTFEEDLFAFLEDNGIKNISHINVNKQTIYIMFKLDENTTMKIGVAKELFE